MQADAIQRVSNAIGDAVRAALLASGHPGAVVIGPPDDKNANDAQIVLFPFKLLPNTSLRNMERVIPPDMRGDVLTHENSLPLDVFYLLTVGNPFAADSEAPIAPDSQVWLGVAIRALQSSPDLIGEAVGGDTVRLSLEPTTTEEMSRIWALFPNAEYRTSVVYLASPVWIDPLQAPVAARVVDDRRLSGQRAA